MLSLHSHAAFSFILKVRQIGSNSASMLKSEKRRHFSLLKLFKESTVPGNLSVGVKDKCTSQHPFSPLTDIKRRQVRKAVC